MKTPKSYSDFTLEHLRVMFGITNKESVLNLLQYSIEPSAWLVETLSYSRALRINTEKARSELLITPILMELAQQRAHTFQCFSGNTLDVDRKQALKGRCDFLLTKHLSLDISAPIIAIFEAKDDNIEHWYGQCGAEMLAARIFNEQRNEPITTIHGAVTNGRDWRFLRLEGAQLLIDNEIYSLAEIPKLLGVLHGLIDFYHTSSVF
ncbi:MAG: hypothetical protein EAZ92_08870 [Candidatus Kapaibacterium sp.]|nr:MAG: hypothetical protein EAZ92_08870 [Candidatus Kapabacteria bacterium]